jgi:hypothetical protein
MTQHIECREHHKVSESVPRSETLQAPQPLEVGVPHPVPLRITADASGAR